MAQSFPDPVHLGTHASLGIATTSDVLAASLVITGLATRPAALFIASNIAVAWIFVHRGQYFGSDGDHGELCALYIGGFLVITVCDAGRFSIDARFKSNADSRSERTLERAAL